MMKSNKLVLVFLFAAVINVALAASISVFVSTSGSDSTGTGSIDAPFQTIGKAKDYVRSLVKNNGDSIFVEIRGGTYIITEALLFDSQDSGVEGSPITYRAYQGEEVKVIPGATIGGWTTVTDQAILDRLKPEAKTNVRVADLGSLDMGTLVRRGIFVPGGTAAMELFFKTEPMTLARYPNTGFMTTTNALSNEVTFSFVPGADSAVSIWNQEPDPHAFGYWQFPWADEYAFMNSISLVDTTVTANLGYRPVFGLVSGTRFYVHNFLCELDAPGEYYIDRNNSKIYFWPPSNDFTQSDMVVSVVDHFINMDKTSYVNFEGFTIEASRTEAIYGKSVHDINIYGLTIRNIGTIGITITESSNVLIERCLIENTGDIGLSLSGGDRPSLTRSNITARNNVVRKFSRWSKTYNPAFKVNGVGITIEHNEMYDAPHNAIWFFGNYHTFQYNIVHDVCKETQDVGAFYSDLDWTYRGNVIKNNLFYDINGLNNEGAVGVYLDDQFSSAEVVGNIFYNVSTAMKVGGGRNNHLKNNIVINSYNTVWIDARGTGACGPVNNQTLYNTLDSMPIYSDVWATAFPDLAAILDNDPTAPYGTQFGLNIFVNYTFTYMLCTEQAVSPYVTYSDDCLDLSLDDFVDPLSRNFTLKDGAFEKCSSADFKAMFEPIPFEMIGVIKLPDPPVAPPVSSPIAGSSPSSPSSPSNSPVSGNTPKAQISDASILSALYAALLVLPFML